MMHLPNDFFFGRYVEGWLVEERTDAVRVIEHGWLETGPGVIIDPTLVLEDPPIGVEYLAGQRLSWQEVQRYTGSAFPRARYRTAPTLTYQAACQQALEHAERLAWHTGKPLLPCPGGMTMAHFHRR